MKTPQKTIDELIEVLQMPHVNLNGTSRQELVGQQLEVWLGLNTAMGALAKAVPHARDYQTAVAPKEAYKRARHEWNIRMGTLRNLMAETEAIMQYISDRE